MTQIILSDTTAEEVLQQATLKGYDNPEDYLLALIEADAALRALDVALGQEFKQAFKDAVRGKAHSKADYKRMMAEDD